jgi:hypothetical protein
VYERARRILDVVFWTALVVSVVHYSDNFLGYDSYPHPDSGLDPSKGVILAAWFVFTALGATGYVLFRRRRIRPAVLFLAAYSGSGLVGIGHYTVGGMTDAVWWRQAHVAADILLGTAMLAFAVWAALTLRSDASDRQEPVSRSASGA